MEERKKKNKKTSQTMPLIAFRTNRIQILLKPSFLRFYSSSHHFQPSNSIFQISRRQFAREIPKRNQNRKSKGNGKQVGSWKSIANQEYLKNQLSKISQRFTEWDERLRVGSYGLESKILFFFSFKYLLIYLIFETY